MSKLIGKLSALEVAKAKKAGMYADGGNLYLQVSNSGAKSWIFRYSDLSVKTPDSKYVRREMGLGSFHTLSLADARDKAAFHRKQLLDGIDPIRRRQQERSDARLAASRNKTFRECAKEYIATHEAGWTNDKHKWQWNHSLSKYVYPIIGDTPVQEIDFDAVMRVLKPIWGSITETATRIRQRIESILNWATVHQYRNGENPARWRGHMEKALPSPAKLQTTRHYPALPHPQVGKLFARLESNHPGTAALALRFIILTASRSGEVRGARWGEFDLNGKLWTVPAKRMKTRKEHRVPLSQKAIDILLSMHCQTPVPLATGLVFPSQKAGQPLSDMAILMLLRRMDHKDITVHGFRSTFRDWAAECTGYGREPAEAALAHTVENQVEAAYFRTDLFEKRRKLMEDWAGYCGLAQIANATF